MTKGLNLKAQHKSGLNNSKRGGMKNLQKWGRRFEPHWCHCIVSLSKNINPSLVLVQPRKTGPYITERLLMGRKESQIKQTNLPKKYGRHKTPQENENFLKNQVE